MKKTSICFWLFVIGVALYAGDVANFVSLGFSADGNKFAFGQYGVKDKTYQSYSEIYCVDIEKNSFLKNGIFKTSPTKETASVDSKAVFSSLLTRAQYILKDLNISQEVQGRPLYVQTADTSTDKTLIFRDFETETEYTAVIHVDRQNGMEASFYISLDVIKQNGSKIKKELGRSSYTRSGVKDYVIKKVLINSNNDGLVFIIEKRIRDSSGDSIRYMVETVKL